MAVFDSTPGGGSRRNALAVLLAVAVLAVLGAIFGYVLGTRATAGDNLAGGDRAGTGQPGRPQVTTASPTVTTAASPSARTGKACPAITDRAARDAGSRGDLRQRLYIKTDQSEVWICEDSAGRLWYQGHRLSGPFNAATGSDSLFLSNVNYTGAEGYLAVNVTEQGRTDYLVSTTRLVIRDHRSGRSDVQPVRHAD